MAKNGNGFFSDIGNKLSNLTVRDVVMLTLILYATYYVMRNVFGCSFKGIPILENFENQEVEDVVAPLPSVTPPSPPSVTPPSPPMAKPPVAKPPMAKPPVAPKQATPQRPQVVASEASGNEVSAPVTGIDTGVSSCYPQNTLAPQDLLPEGSMKQVQDFDANNQIGEGILKGVNFLDAGFHVGVNTVGQSLRNANLNLRAEPPNPRVQVSPWLNSTIAPDLARLTLDGEDVCEKAPVGSRTAKPAGKPAGKAPGMMNGNGQMNGNGNGQMPSSGNMQMQTR